VRFGRGAVLLAAAGMAGGLAGCGGGDEPTEPSTTVSPRTPAGQGKTSDASQGETSEASGSSSSGASTDESSTNSSEGGGSSGASVGADGLPHDIAAVANKRNKEGAAAFGKYYYDQIGEASKSGDPSVAEAMALKSCPPCRSFVKNIRGNAEKGLKHAENPYTITAVESSKRPDSGYKVSMDVDVSQHVVYKNGQAYGEVDATSYHVTQHVVWRSGTWKVADWAIS